MNPEQAVEVGMYLKEKREGLGMTTYQVGDKANVDQSQVVRVENGQILKLTPDLLQRLALAVNAPVVDVFTLAGYPLPKGLPGLRPYMRAKYRTLTPEALDEVEAFVTQLAQRDDLRGPKPGEDEQ